MCVWERERLRNFHTNIRHKKHIEQNFCIFLVSRNAKVEVFVLIGVMGYVNRIILPFVIACKIWILKVISLNRFWFSISIYHQKKLLIRGIDMVKVFAQTHSFTLVKFQINQPDVSLSKPWTFWWSTRPPHKAIESENVDVDYWLSINEEWVKPSDIFEKVEFRLWHLLALIVLICPIHSFPYEVNQVSWFCSRIFNKLSL